MKYFTFDFGLRVEFGLCFGGGRRLNGRTGGQVLGVGKVGALVEQRQKEPVVSVERVVGQKLSDLMVELVFRQLLRKPLSHRMKISANGVTDELVVSGLAAGSAAKTLLLEVVAETLVERLLGLNQLVAVLFAGRLTRRSHRLE